MRKIVLLLEIILCALILLLVVALNAHLLISSAKEGLGSFVFQLCLTVGSLVGGYYLGRYVGGYLRKVGYFRTE